MIQTFHQITQKHSQKCVTQISNQQIKNKKYRTLRYMNSGICYRTEGQSPWIYTRRFEMLQLSIYYTTVTVYWHGIDIQLSVSALSCFIYVALFKPNICTLFCLVHIKKRSFLTSCVFWFVSFSTSSHLCFQLFFYTTALQNTHFIAHFCEHSVPEDAWSRRYQADGDRLNNVVIRSLAT